MSILVKVLDKKAKIIEKPSAMIKRKKYFYLRSIANFIELHALHMFGFSMKIVMLTKYCSMQVLFFSQTLAFELQSRRANCNTFFKANRLHLNFVYVVRNCVNTLFSPKCSFFTILIMRFLFFLSDDHIVKQQNIFHIRKLFF